MSWLSVLCHRGGGSAPIIDHEETLGQGMFSSSLDRGVCSLAFICLRSSIRFFISKSSSCTSSSSVFIINVTALSFYSKEFVWSSWKVVYSDPTLIVNFDSWILTRAHIVLGNCLPRIMGISPSSFISRTTKSIIKTNLSTLTSKSFTSSKIG